MISTTLAYFPSPAQGVWHLGPIPIRAYALCIIIGIIAALVIGDRRWAARGGERGVIYDIALWAVPFGLIGGRLYHVMTDWKTYFGPEGAGPVAALKIWDGGLGIWGAVALGAVGAWIGCKRRGIPLPAFGDAIAPGIVLAQAIGRLGNYFNQELYGRVTTVPWGLEIFYRQDPSGILDVHSLSGVSTGQLAEVVHPTFLYELLWNLLVFALLIYADRRFTIGHGRLFALYVAAYCVGRFGVELLRDDTATLIAGIRINSFTATFVFIGAVVYFILATKGREDPSTLGGNAEDETVSEELAKDLVSVAATTGVVAAATAAGREDSDGDDLKAEDADEAQTEVVPVIPEPEPVATDADDVDASVEDEAIIEAEAAAPDVETETGVVAEDEDLIDEDHDPVDEEDLEGLNAAPAAGVAVSEQEEELDSDDEAADDDELVAAGDVEPELSTNVDAVEENTVEPEGGAESELVAGDVEPEPSTNVDAVEEGTVEAEPELVAGAGDVEPELSTNHDTVEEGTVEPEAEPAVVEAEPVAGDVEPEPSTNVDAVEEGTVEAEPVLVAGDVEPEPSTNVDAVEEGTVEAEAAVAPDAETDATVEGGPVSEQEDELVETDDEEIAETDAGAAAAEADAEPVAVETPEPSATDADDVEGSVEDEAIVEAEAAAPDVETETGAVAEDEELIDEDHDPVDEEDLEDEEAAPAVGAPVSEQDAELGEGDDEPATADELVAAEDAEPEVSIDADDVPAEAVGGAEPEALAEPEEPEPAPPVIPTPTPAAPASTRRSVWSRLRRRG